MPFIGLGSGIFISHAERFRMMCIEFPWRAPGHGTPAFRVRGRTWAVEGGWSQVATGPIRRTTTVADQQLSYSLVLRKLQSQESSFLPATGRHNLLMRCCVAIRFKGISFTTKTPESSKSIDSSH